MSKSRKKIPGHIEADIMFKSHLQCCVCQQKGDHIHHIDENPSNNNLDNLILLCFKHHELATIKGNLSKKLTKPTLLKYREEHYRNIENERRAKSKSFDKPLIESNLTEEKLLEISKNALIIIELEKIKERYFKAEWKEKSEILSELHKYAHHTNIRLAFEVLQFLSMAANQTRSGMPEQNALGIYSTLSDFIPHFDAEEQIHFVELGKESIDIAFSITYDSFIYLRKLSVAIWGLTIVNEIYLIAKQCNNFEIKALIKEFYSNIHLSLNRPERDDLKSACILVKAFETNLEENSLSTPVLPREIYLMIQNENHSINH